MSNPYQAYVDRISATPQTQPILGRELEMKPNNAGGYGFLIDDWDLLHRFLILGTNSGTYYVGESKLTADNAGLVIRCVKADGQRVVALARDVNVNNRAPKTDQQIFALALALKHGDAATKSAVGAAASEMLRTGTHLLHFVAMLDSLGGWNRSKRRIVANWFTAKSPDALAYHVLKYQSRDGWSARDALRVAHPEAPTDAHKAVFDWICGRTPEAGLPALLDGHRQMQAAIASGMEPVAAAWLGLSFNLPREALPTEALANPHVWRAMLPHTPIHALLRNLGNLTEKGVLANGSDACNLVREKLTDVEAMRKARVHPFAILLATLVYVQGHGVRGSKTWTPVPAVVSALEDAYDLAFQAVTPTNKRILIAIDVSGSMSYPCMGTPIPAATAAAAMAITLARLEPHALVVQFDVAVRKVVPVTKRTTITSIVNNDGGGTDLSAAVRWASGENAEISRGWGRPAVTLPASVQHYDAFVILSDNETWAGSRHTSEVLQSYRRAVNPRAKLVCCSMAANTASVVDPTDMLSLGAAGLDANLPSIVSDFICR